MFYQGAIPCELQVRTQFKNLGINVVHMLFTQSFVKNFYENHQFYLCKLMVKDKQLENGQKDRGLEMIFYSRF
jgi:hypothetical protein